MAGLHGAGGAGDGAGRARSDLDAVESGSGAVNAGEFTHHPLTDCAEGIVGKRVHGWLVNPLALDVGIPAFPDGGGTVVHLVAPARIFALLHEDAREVMMASG
jgi:hypothetical protein